MEVLRVGEGDGKVFVRGGKRKDLRLHFSFFLSFWSSFLVSLTLVLVRSSEDFPRHVYEPYR